MSTNPASVAWRSKREPAKPARKDQLVDLKTTFGISFASDGSDSSDAEFAPEDEHVDSEDSVESEGANRQVTPIPSEEPGEDEPRDSTNNSEDTSQPAESANEYNPLIVRRSQRAIKPTKDVDLYLLGAKYGVDLEGSDADSSDLEFAPEAVSDVDSNSSLSSSGTEANVATSASVSKVLSDDEVSGVSESYSVQQLSQSASEKYEVPLCSVCLEDSGEDGDLVECDRCGIAVHEGCYGVPEQEDIREDRSDLSSFTTVPWFCDTCKAGITSALCCCELCPTIGGLFKQTINGKWVHVVCSLYTPNIEYVEPSQLSGVTLDQFPASRWGSKVCQLCTDLRMSKTGVCIGCDAGLCKSSFHVTCAQQHGLLCEVDSDEEEENKELCDPFFAHCKAHADKDTIKRKRRDYLAVINKQKKFAFDESDERIQHYLIEAEVQYSKFFEKMQNYYQPEQCFNQEERLLHTVPSALKRLTMKAKLLGHISEELEVESRRKIAPALTTDFVSYFHERQNLIQSLQQQQEALNSAHENLEKEQAQVKHQLTYLQRSLSRSYSCGQGTQNRVSSLYRHLSKFGFSQLPDFLEEERSSEMVDKEVVCAVCHKSEEQYLMALCDTCNQYYHIGCLDPPLSKVPKKSAKWGWQCHNCCCSSGDELLPVMANFDEPSSRSGRKIKVPKVLSYPDYQVKQTKKKKKR